jgi:hypothetical protein
VEASPEDDFGGAFEVEEINEDEEIRLGEEVEEDDVQSDIIDTVEEIEPFAFKEVETTPYKNENIISLGEYPEESPVAENEADQGFVFSEEPEFVDDGAVSTGGRFAESPETSGLAVAEYANESSLSVPGFVDMTQTAVQAVDMAIV